MYGIIIRFLCLTGLILHAGEIYCQKKGTPEVEHFPIGTASVPADAEVKLELAARFQQYNWHPEDSSDILDQSIFSPKSAAFTPDGKKLYVNSLEGYSTSVYDVETLERTKVIKHQFNAIEDAELFLNNEHTVFGYTYQNRTVNHNTFSGKPVECCFTHDGKYLWVTYYRRSYDLNAQSPSAVAIIDTETDEIVRVMPTGPLPKMIAASPDNKCVAITHWGDNTVGIIDITGDSIEKFSYVSHFIVDERIILSFDEDKKVDRDHGCGYCLRGTTFSPDSEYLFVAKMGGDGGIALFDMEKMEYKGAVYGSKANIRHIVAQEDKLFIGCNVTGFVQQAKWHKIIETRINNHEKNVYYNDWESCNVGYGVRTIVPSPDGRYIFACVNGENKIAVIRSADMTEIASIGADSYPVGMSLSQDAQKLVVTSQGKSRKGGNSVMIYDIQY